MRLPNQHMNSTVRRLSLSLCLVSALLSGCSSEQSVPALLASAHQYLERNDYKAAALQLRNVLQKEPNLAEARLLLGRALLEDGQLIPAGVEVRKALELGSAQDEVVPLLAQVMLAEGKAAVLLERYGSTVLSRPQIQATLLSKLALAQFALDQRARGEALLQSALALDPQHVEARLLRARLLAAVKDQAGARALVDEVLQQQQVPEAWITRGDLLVETDPDGAVQAYRKAVEQHKHSLIAYNGLIVVLLSQGKLDEAAQELTRLKVARPGVLRVALLEAQLAVSKGDSKQARELLQGLLKALPDDPEVLQLAGLVEAQGGSLLQALSYINKVVHLLPDAIAARQVQSQLLLRMGEPAKALDALQPLLAQQADAQTLALAARAHEQQGQLDQAEAMFRKAAALNPSDVRARTALELTKFARGQAVSAIEALQTLAASDQGTVADEALISARLRRQDFDGALQAIDALEKKSPGKPLALMLRGRVQLALSKPALARQSFEQALRENPTYLPAALNLATLDMRDKQYEAAQGRFDALLKADPGNLQGLLTVARIRTVAGAPATELTRRYEDVVRRNPNEGLARVALIEHLLSLKNTDAALAASRDAVAAIPDNPGLLAVMARVHMLSGDTNQAISSLNKLVAQQPNSVQALMLLAQAHATVKDTAEAVAVLRRAQALAPKDIQVHARLGGELLQAGRTEEALAVARALQKQRDTESMGYVLEGSIEAARKRWHEASRAYRMALQKQPSTEGAIVVHTMLRQFDKAEAAAFAAKWLAEHGNDAGFVQYLGDAALSQGDYAQAELRYTALSKLRPELPPQVLNNMAWAMLQQGKAGAVGLGEKLNRLHPDVPAYMDTLAMALAAENRWDRALELQKRAVELDAGKTPALRLNLARLYRDAGQRTQARVELDALSKLGTAFKQQPEVARMLQQL